ncbi:MAG: hypothetical protein WDA03_09075 [Trueperaceae bacterium]
MHRNRGGLWAGLAALLALTGVAWGQEQATVAADLRPLASSWVRGPAMVIDTFQFDTRFELQSSAGSVEPDLTEVLLGTRTLRLESDGDGRQVNLRAAGLEAMDLSNVFLRLRLKVAPVEHLRSMYLYLSHDGFATHDAYELYAQAPALSERRLDDGEWGVFTLNLGSPLEAPQVDLTRVTGVQLSVVDDGKAPVSVWLDGLDALEAPQRGVVTVMFDDARSGVYELGLPQAQRHGVRASVAVIRDLVGVDTFMTLEQLQLVERFADWEVVAHHATPLDQGFDSLTEEQLRAELAGVKRWMLEHGFRRGADVIVYPHGLIDGPAIEAVRGYFAAGRTVTRGGGLETLPPADPYRLRAFSVESSDTVEAIKAVIDRAARDRGWLILVFHQLVNYPPEYGAQYGGIDFALVMAHLAAADVDVLTFSEAVLGR